MINSSLNGEVSQQCTHDLIAHGIMVNLNEFLKYFVNKSRARSLPSGTMVKRSPCHWEISSSNPGDVTSTRGQELQRAKSSCDPREGGVAYSLCLSAVM